MAGPIEGKTRLGILIANTGTPDNPTPRAVRRYLRRFLMDRRIAPMNRLVWFFILNFAILPKRAQASSEKYQHLWTDEGFPFRIAHEKIARALEQEMSSRGDCVVVRAAMSYGEPSVLCAVRSLKEAGCQRVLVLPLYPQSALSTTGAVSDGVARAMRKAHWKVPVSIISDYHVHPSYVQAIAGSIRHAGFRADSSDRLLFSYHSIPLTDIEAGDVYELQSGATSLMVASALGLDRKRWSIAYQCRFDKGREWLRPFTRDTLRRWAIAGEGRVFLVCPNFAVDCLETSFEIPHELRPEFFSAARDEGRALAQDSFVYVPCLNASRKQVRMLADVVTSYLNEE